MSFFKKKDGVETIDFTALQKRGILEKKPVVVKNPLSSFVSSVQSQSSSEQTNSSFSSGDMFGALDSLAGTSSNNNISSFANNEQDVNSLKVKIDDLEFKLERLLEKIDFLEKKMGNSS